MTLALGIVLSVTVFASGSARGDLQIAGYQDRLHDRFYVGSDKAFIGTGFNWSGHGRLQDPSGDVSNWKQLTMISDNWFITSEHNRPTLRDDPSGIALPKVRFYRTNDPAGEYWESEIAVEGIDYAGVRIEATDLWVGKLANTPPSWVLRYPLAKHHEATNYLSYTDSNLFIFGQDSPRSLSSVRVGRNEIGIVYPGGNFEWDYNAAAGLGPDEAQTESGDSGGPSFLTAGQVPVLAGIHTRVNYDTGVSTKLQQIMAAVGEPISVSTGLIGDLNGDFRVDVGDLAVFGSRYGTSQVARYHQGDVTGDARVDFFDLIALSQKFGQGLYAPTDFDRDGDVDGNDLATIASNWSRFVAVPYAAGDANGDAFVGVADVEIFDRNQYRAYFGPLPPPLLPTPGDLTGNGVVDGFDLSVVTGNFNMAVPPGTSGDADGNGIVNNADLSFVALRLGNSFGDISGDHLVGPNDFAILATNWNRSVAGGRLSGDMNGDGIVNSSDATVLFGWWDMEGGTFPEMTPVPEPTTTMLLASSLLVLLGISRRQEL